MFVSFKTISMMSSTYVAFSNVAWVRLTENKVLIECKDGRKACYSLKKVIDFEVKCL